MKTRLNSNVDVEQTFPLLVISPVGMASCIAQSVFIFFQDREYIEILAKQAFASLPEDYKGTYYSFESMSPEDEKQLIEDHFLFKNDDRWDIFYFGIHNTYGKWVEVGFHPSSYTPPKILYEGFNDSISIVPCVNRRY
jgi:hypothetical protein